MTAYFAHEGHSFSHSDFWQIDIRVEIFTENEDFSPIPVVNQVLKKHKRALKSTGTRKIEFFFNCGNIRRAFMILVNKVFSSANT